MKKALLSFLTAISLGSFTEVKAQLAMTNFNTGFPSTWTMIKVDANTPNSSYWVTSIVNGLSTNAWMTWAVGTGDSAMISTSYFNTPGTADRWMITPVFAVNNPNMIITWEDAEFVQGSSDSIEVWASATGGNTVASFTTMLYSGPATATDASGGLQFVKKGVPIGAYNGQNITLAFRHHTYNGGLCGIDNVATEVPANVLDGKVVSAGFPQLLPIGGSSTNPSMVVQNVGATIITSLSINYQVDGGTPVTQNVPSVYLWPYGTVSINFTTPEVNPSTGSHSLVVNLVNVNGSPDPVASNNSATTAFSVPNSSVVRNGLMEEFSSSTCNPCHALNNTLDPVIDNDHADDPATRFNLIRYQMNWPSPGTDASYNQDGLDRRIYYGVNGIPDDFINGAQGNLSSASTASDCQSEIDGTKTDSALMDITGTYVVDTVGHTLSGSATITPHFTITSGAFTVYMASCEKHYQNPGNTTGQLDYYRVMRMMFPDGNGTATPNWTNGTPQTFNFSKPYIVGGVAQMNTHFWQNPANSYLVVFVQDNISHNILQSYSLQGPTTSVKNISGGANNIMIYPNPATSFVNVTFELTNEDNVNLSVTDVVGKVVYTTQEQMSSGKHTITIPTNDVAAGIYNVMIQTENGMTSSRISVVK